VYYSYSLVISTSSDGVTYTNVSYVDFNWPGIGSAPSYVTTKPYLAVVVTTKFDGDTTLANYISSYSYTVKTVTNVVPWDCDSVTTSSSALTVQAVDQRLLDRKLDDSIETITNPCSWYGEY
jgi:hypothetical protein